VGQRLINSDESLGLHNQAVSSIGMHDHSISLTQDKRLDAPHWFFAQFIELDDELELHSENSSMSWRSKVSWWCDPRQWIRTIVHLQDTPHAIALGTAIGVFIGLTPSFGIQMLLVLAIAFLARPFFHFNQFAALVAVYVSNPFTMLPIYWFNYRLGTLFISSDISWDEFKSLFQYSDYSEWFSTIANVFYTLGAPLVIGSLIVATVFALPTYPLMLRLVEKVQLRRKLRKAKKAQQKSESQIQAAVAEHDSL
jgi:uncharacterized protein